MELLRAQHINLLSTKADQGRLHKQKQAGLKAQMGKHKEEEKVIDWLLWHSMKSLH
jgi:hypothetical protein